MKIKNGILIILQLLFVSCTTTKNISKNNTMFVMIYDMESNPISGAELYINGKLQGTSDVQGRFLISSVKSGIVKVKIIKPNYSEIETEIMFDPMQVGYFKTGTANQYFNIAKENLSKGDLKKAEYYGNKALSLSPGRNDILFLIAIIFNKKGDKEKSTEILSKIKTSEDTNLYIEKLKERNNEN